jgi:hypothetical protein
MRPDELVQAKRIRALMLEHMRLLLKLSGYLDVSQHDAAIDKAPARSRYAGLR